MNARTGFPPSTSSSFEVLSTGLEKHGFAVLADALPPDVARALLDYSSALGPEAFHSAAIGRRGDRQQDRSIRRDQIHWMDDRDPALALWRAWTESLRLQLNRQLFLGLFSFESHLAHYRPGDYYRKHVDAFKGEANRVVSLVCYLNEDWMQGDGGELVLDTVLGTVTVEPRFRTVILFLAEHVPHEVKPARRDRYSVTGWFRLNSSSADRVDPPN